MDSKKKILEIYAKAIVNYGSLLVLLSFACILFYFLKPKDTSEYTNQMYCGTAVPETNTCGNSIPTESKTLFNNNCASCHKIDKKSTGPAIKGMQIRFNNDDMLFAYVLNEDSLQHNFQTFYDSIFQDYGLDYKHHFPQLTKFELEIFFLNYSF